MQLESLNTLIELTYPAEDFVNEDSWVPVMCPVCKEIKGDDYSKLKLYINPERNFGWCMVCHTKFYSNDEKGFVPRVNCFNSFEIDSVPVDLDYSKYSANGVAYLKKRNPYITKSLIKDAQLQCKATKIVVPFFIKKDPVYYQIRYINPINEKKYFNPPIEHKPLYTVNYDIFKPTIFVEGVFDALAIYSVTRDFNVIAVLGSTITEYQYKVMRYLGGISRGFIFLDETRLSFELLRKLRKFGFRGKLVVIESSGKDPEECLVMCGKDKFLNILDYYKTGENYGRSKII